MSYYRPTDKVLGSVSRADAKKLQMYCKLDKMKISALVT